jgi:nitric oxide reductase activation protein
MRRFCGYGDSDKDDRIFDYFAAGWNRDGLAVKGAGHMMQTSPSGNRLLIILTDASPNDDRRLLPDRSNGHHISRDYSGEAGVEDTAAEVRTLRKSGIQVMAILNGEDGSTEAARKIYGDDFVRIENIRHLSDAVGNLLLRKIEKLTL